MSEPQPPITRQPSVISQLRMLMPPRPVSYAEAMTVAELQANRLLELSQITDPAVPNLVITDLPRLDVDYVDNLPMSGYTTYENGRWHIVINRSDYAMRARFTLAHEFKHLLDHPFVERAYRQITKVTPAEATENVAEYFAACLLMPKAWIKASFCHDAIQDPRRLANRFAVSEAAMRRRLRELGLVESVPRHGPRYQRALQPGVLVTT